VVYENNLKPNYFFKKIVVDNDPRPHLEYSNTIIASRRLSTRADRCVCRSGSAGCLLVPYHAHDCCPGTPRGKGMEAGPTSGIGGISEGSRGDWAKVLGRLREQVGETAYRSWFRSMTVERVASNASSQRAVDNPGYKGSESTHAVRRTWCGSLRIQPKINYELQVFTNRGDISAIVSI